MYILEDEEFKYDLNLDEDEEFEDEESGGWFRWSFRRIFKRNKKQATYPTKKMEEKKNLPSKNSPSKNPSSKNSPSKSPSNKIVKFLVLWIKSIT